MKITELKANGLLLITSQVFRDDRGFFVERFKSSWLKDAGVDVEFVQENHSRSLPGVLRGLHYQVSPAQGKWIGVIRGSIWDVVVDLRQESKTYGQKFNVELSGENGQILWIPPGFAHGFCVLGDEPADIIYQVTTLYSPQGEGGIRWNDPELAIDWPVQSPIVSARDQKLPLFEDYKKSPVKKWV